MPKGIRKNGTKLGFQKGHSGHWKNKKFSDIHKGNIAKGTKGKNKGSINPMWKGGRKIADGYIYILKPNHPKTDNRGYVKRCVLTMEKMLGRFLKDKEMVHHKNKIRDDDRPINLRLFKNQSEHTIFHNFTS